MAKKQKYLMICPKCKSPDIYRDQTTKIDGALGLPPVYICNKCGHSSTTFPEVAVDEFGKFEKKVDHKHLRSQKKDKTELVDTSYGDIEVRVMWKITGPLILFLGIAISFVTLWLGIPMVLFGGLLVYTTYFKYRKLR